MLFSVQFSLESLENTRITIIHVYFSALRFAVCLGSILNSGSKQLRLATANVKERKNMYDPYNRNLLIYLEIPQHIA